MSPTSFALRGDRRAQGARAATSRPTSCGRRLRLTRGIADTLADRPADALAILNADGFPEEADALMWRSIAQGRRSATTSGARLDAMAAESRRRAPTRSGSARASCFAAIRAAIETNDHRTWRCRYLGLIEFAKLDPEQVTHYQLLQGAHRGGRGPRRRGARHLRPGDRRRHPADPRRGGVPDAAAARQDRQDRPRQGHRDALRRGAAVARRRRSKPTCRSSSPSSISATTTTGWASRR